MSYLFGDILMVSKQDLLLIGALDLIVVSVVFVFYNKLISVCFDETTNTHSHLAGVKQMKAITCPTSRPSAL